MHLRLVFIIIMICSLTGCTGYKKLTVSFKDGSGFYEGMEIKLNNQKIGNVFKIKLHNKKILTRIKLDNKIKIPSGSQFIIYEPLIGDAFIKVELSENKTFLTSRDTVNGIVKPVRVGQ